MSGEIPQSDVKRLKNKVEVSKNIAAFLQHKDSIRRPLLNRMKEIRDKIEISEFFKYHEIIGSSVLILYDEYENVGAWMIDFAKTMPVSTSLNHRKAWELGNHEDGYLIGMDNLIDILEKLDVT